MITTGAKDILAHEFLDGGSDLGGAALGVEAFSFVFGEQRKKLSQLRMPFLECALEDVPTIRRTSESPSCFAR